MTESLGLARLLWESCEHSGWQHWLCVDQVNWVSGGIKRTMNAPNFRPEPAELLADKLLRFKAQESSFPSMVGEANVVSCRWDTVLCNTSDSLSHNHAPALMQKSWPECKRRQHVV